MHRHQEDPWARPRKPLATRDNLIGRQQCWLIWVWITKKQKRSRHRKGHVDADCPSKGAVPNRFGYGIRRGAKQDALASSPQREELGSLRLRNGSALLRL